MSNTTGILIALAILVHAAAPVWPVLRGDSHAASFQVVSPETGFAYRINTETGKIWVSIGNEPWRRLYELGINVLPESVEVE